MERQAAAERARRAAITEAEKQAAILMAKAELEASRREAEARIVLATASKDSLTLIKEGVGTEQLPAIFLLAEKYVGALQEISTSNNAKTVVLPADLPAAFKNMFGFKGL